MNTRQNRPVLRVLMAVIVALIFTGTICSLLGNASIDAARQGSAPNKPTGLIENIAPVYAHGLSLASAKLFFNRSCGSDELYLRPSYVTTRLTSPPETSISLFIASDACGHTDTGVGHVLSINVAADDTYAYWLTRNGYIVRNRHNTTPFTNPEIVRSMVNTNPTSSPPAYSIAANVTTIAWNEGRQIYSTPKSIGGDYTLLGSTTLTPRKLYLSSTRLLYLDGANLMYMRLYEPSHPTSIIANNVSDFYVDGVWIYFGQNLATSYQIRSANLNDPTIIQTPPHYTSPVDPSLKVSYVAAGGGRLYWFEKQGSFGGQIYMMTLDYGSRSAQSASLRNISAMVADSNYLYWLSQADGEVGVFRLTPGSAVVDTPGDMSITAITVTQGMQVGNNLIPLVEWKPTVVRVFVASTAGNHGAWQNVRARLDVEGSSVAHYATMSELPTASDKRILNSTFNFALSEAETLETVGVYRHITATLFSMSGRREDNRTNNTFSKHLLFFEHRELSLATFRYSNLNRGACATDAADGYVTPWNNIITHTVDARDVLPIHLMSVYTATGMGIPALDDSHCLAYREAISRTEGWIDRNYATGGHYALVMQPDSLHHGGSCLHNTIGNYIINIQDYYPNHTLAHEVSHITPGVYQGNNHTWDAASHYPRPRTPPDTAEWMGDFIGLQLFGSTRLILGSNDPSVPTHDVWDLMSYGEPRWASPYTYCKDMKYMSGGAYCCPDTVEGGCSSEDLPSQEPDRFQTSADNTAGSEKPGIQMDPDWPEADNPYLYVSGKISLTNEVSLNPFEIVESSKNISTPCSGSGYTISLLDGSGSTLQNCTFDALPTHIDYFDDPAPTPAPYLFSAYLPWDSNTFTIAVDYKGSILAQRTVSKHAPLNVVQAFSPSEPVTGTHTLSWIASDEDDDPLVFSIWYSPDNGGTWLPIEVSNTNPDQNTEIDFNLLPGSSDGEGLLRVLASDGVLTTESRTETTFTVEHKPPSIGLVPTYGPDGYITLVQANATDPEDQVISDPALFDWSSNWDGLLGDGLIFNTARLSPGEHVLTATVKDYDLMQASAAITVNVPSNFESGGLVAQPAQLGHLFFDASLPLTLTVPAGSVKETVRFRASLPLDTSFDPPGAIGPSFVITAALSNGWPVVTFNAPLTLTIAYDHDVIPVHNERRARIYTWDEVNLRWDGLDTTVDPINNRARASVIHLSQFVLVVPSEHWVYLPIIRK